MRALLSLTKVTCVGHGVEEEDDEPEELSSSVISSGLRLCTCKISLVIKILADRKPVASARRELSIPKHGPLAWAILSPAVVARDQPKDIQPSLPDPSETIRKGVSEAKISIVVGKSVSKVADRRSWCCHGTRLRKRPGHVFGARAGGVLTGGTGRTLVGSYWKPSVLVFRVRTGIGLPGGSLAETRDDRGGPILVRTTGWDSHVPGLGEVHMR